MGVLRVFLALAVVASHTGDFGFLKMMGGGEAVQLFFVISGFYMSLILDKKYHSNSLFYSNRFLRLYPAYALVLLATMTWFMIDWAYTRHRPPPYWIAEANVEMAIWQWLALQFSSLTMVGLDLPALFHWKSGQGFMFLTFAAESAPDGVYWAGQFSWISQAWSVGTEMWFYVLAPFLLRRHIVVQTAIASASLFLMIWMTSTGLQAYFFFPANLWLFIAGSILFRFYQCKYFKYFSIPNWSGFAALAYVLFAVCAVGSSSNVVVHIIALMLIALCLPFLFDTFSRKDWDAIIGNLSYPVYLVHALIISVVTAVFHAGDGIVVAVLSLLVAAFIARYVDDPVSRYRQRRVERQSYVSTKELTVGIEKGQLNAGAMVP
jgi:peptidoglycan/LPS O-acetylase OafA/YrhL